MVVPAPEGVEERVRRGGDGVELLGSVEGYEEDVFGGEGDERVGHRWWGLGEGTGERHGCLRMV